MGYEEPGIGRGWIVGCDAACMGGGSGYSVPTFQRLTTRPVAP